MQVALALLLLVSKKELIVKQSPPWQCLTSTDHSLIKHLNPCRKVGVFYWPNRSILRTQRPAGNNFLVLGPFHQGQLASRIAIQRV
jgi:hypothetical protein